VDNLTHTLCGWLLSRAGFDRLGPWVPPVMMVSANLPDFETLIDPFASKPDYLMYHRGLSHSLIGAAVLSIGAAVLVWLIGWLLRKRIHEPPRILPALLVCFVGALSHLLLDWFNTYGVKFLLPYNDRRYFGDLAFIADPWMWLIAGGAIFAGTRRSRLQRNVFLFLAACTTAIMVQVARIGMIPSAAVGIWIVLLAMLVTLRITIFAARSPMVPARLGLLLWTVYVAALFLASRTSVSRAYESLKATGSHQTPGLRLAANPVPAVPWRYEVIAYTQTSAEQISVNLIKGTAERHKQINPRLDHPGLAEISETPEYKAWRAFARFPVVTERNAALVLGDLRYRLTDRADWSEQSVPLTSSTLLPRSLEK